MWKLKLASSIVGVPSIPGLTKKENKYSKYARICGLITALVLILFGILSCSFATLWTGIYCILLSVFVFILELPWAPFDFIISLISFFQDYRWRVGLYVVIAIPAFFSVLTIIAALACLITGGFYGFCAFQGEQGEPIQKTTWAGQPISKEDGGKELQESDKNRKKKQSKTSLASTDETTA